VSYIALFSTLVRKFRRGAMSVPLTSLVRLLHCSLFKKGKESKRQPSIAMNSIAGHVVPAVDLPNKTGVRNFDSDRNRIDRDPAFRRSDNESSAENFGGAFAVQLNREKKSHLNGSFWIQGSIGANEHSRNADVLSHSFMPLPLPPDPIPDRGSNFVPPCSGYFHRGCAHGRLQIHPFSLTATRVKRGRGGTLQHTVSGFDMRG
jgi:hypothetical protein